MMNMCVIMLMLIRGFVMLYMMLGMLALMVLVIFHYFPPKLNLARLFEGIVFLSYYLTLGSHTKILLSFCLHSRFFLFLRVVNMFLLHFRQVLFYLSQGPKLRFGLGF